MIPTRHTLMAVALATLLPLTACGGGSGSSGSSSPAGGTYTFRDPYPQFDASSDWGKRVAACGTADHQWKLTAR